MCAGTFENIQRLYCKSRAISNLLTGDETWVHMFEPQRRVDIKQWKRKDQKRPCIAKRTISSKKMLYAVFFNSSGQLQSQLQNVLSLGSDYFSATFYQTYFYYKPSKYSLFIETHFCNPLRKADK